MVYHHKTLEKSASVFFPLLLSNCTIYCISCFSKRIKLTSILLGCGVVLTDLTRTALSELKCYDEYLNWNWFYNLSRSLVSLSPQPSDINRGGYVGHSKINKEANKVIEVSPLKIHWLFFPMLCCFSWLKNASAFLTDDEKVCTIQSDMRKIKL